MGRKLTLVCFSFKTIDPARHQYRLTPVILATRRQSRDQEDFDLKPTQANSSRDPISKKPFTHTHTQRAGGMAEGEGPGLHQNTIDPWTIVERYQRDSVRMCRIISQDCPP
jgi:hypothetical protein